MVWSIPCKCYLHGLWETNCDLEFSTEPKYEISWWLLTLKYWTVLLWFPLAPLGEPYSVGDELLWTCRFLSEKGEGCWTWTKLASNNPSCQIWDFGISPVLDWSFLDCAPIQFQSINSTSWRSCCDFGISNARELFWAAVQGRLIYFFIATINVQSRFKIISTERISPRVLESRIIEH